MNARAIVLMLVVGAAQIHADNWPHWRGPDATGVSAESGLPERWSDPENGGW